MNYTGIFFKRSVVLQPVFDSLLHLLFPHVCAGCGTDLLGKNELICIGCYNRLYKTGFEAMPDNAVEKTLWGRVNITAGMSQYYFLKDSLLQSLIHQFKYKGNKALGIYLGEQMGYSLNEAPRFNAIDLIIPLPLFRAKEKRRGYNQATLLCEGIARITGKKIERNAVVRVQATATQTRKSRIERWQNVAAVFVVDDVALLIGKNILLVDDVITTGATIEACAAAILEAVPEVQLHIATLAYVLES